MLLACRLPRYNIFFSDHHKLPALSVVFEFVPRRIAQT